MDVPAPLQNKDINQILQTVRQYQLFSANALGGPAHHWNNDMFKYTAGARYDLGVGLESYKRMMENMQNPGSDIKMPFDFKLPYPPSMPAPSVSVPMFLKADSDCQQGKAILEGEAIACFTIGGEKRLCLPQVLNSVLKDFPLSVITPICDDLQIYCSRCNSDQLEVFKRTNILPSSSPSCGLITMTDAERLCSALLHKAPIGPAPAPQPSKRFVNEACIPVYHEVFGCGYGYLKSALYTSIHAESIECAQCGLFFSMSRFIGHSHGSQENHNIVHWGFDRTQWRTYLLLDDEKLDDAERQRLEKAFQDIVSRFESMPGDLQRQINVPSASKRKEYPASQVCAEDYSPAKIARHSLGSTSPGLNRCSESEPNHISTVADIDDMKKVDSPPALVDPARVVPSSQTDRYGKHFAPNLELQQPSNLEGKTQSVTDIEVSDVEAQPISPPCAEMKVSPRSPAIAPTSPATSLSSMESDQPSDSIIDKVMALQSLVKMKGLFTTALASADVNSELTNGIQSSFFSHYSAIKEYIQSLQDSDNGVFK